MPKKLLPREVLRQRIELYLNSDELHRIDAKASAAACPVQLPAEGASATGRGVGHHAER